MRRSSYILLLSAAAVLAIAGPAQAGLIGTNVTIDFAGDFNASAMVSVSSAVEVGCTDPTDSTTCRPAEFFPPAGQLFPSESIDIGDMTIALNLASGFPAAQTVMFSGLNFGGPSLIGVSLDTLIPWLTLGDVSFTSNSVTVDINDISDVGGGGLALLTLRTSPVQPAPEPGTLLLLGGGLLALGLRRARRRR